ncbi:MAG: hypothetical protein HQL03_11000 [Nitrospirae bacterium]|nr:hypothetical protein [Nitrospirota bacterium]MBF0591192.1 hypothetical protein [Nitrospirota bacterium]
MDTLKIYERLKNSDLSDKAAKEIAEVLKDFTDSSLATKADVEKLRLEIEKAKTDIEAKIEVKIAEAKIDILKWTFLFWIGQLAAMAALFRFFGK